MYSHLYHYINICKDKNLSEKFSTKVLVKFLKSLPELEEKETNCFGNSQDIDCFINLTLLNAHSFDSWSENNRDEHQTNLIIIVASRSANSDHLLEVLWRRISSFMNWQILKDGNEIL